MDDVLAVLYVDKVCQVTSGTKLNLLVFCAV